MGEQGKNKISFGDLDTFLKIPSNLMFIVLLDVVFVVLLALPFLECENLDHYHYFSSSFFLSFFL